MMLYKHCKHGNWDTNYCFYYTKASSPEIAIVAYIHYIGWV